MASAWATLAAYGVMMIISYFLGRKYYAVPYNVKSVLFYMVLASVLSYISFIDAFRGNYYVATTLVLVFLGIIFISEKKELKQLLKSKKN